MDSVSATPYSRGTQAHSLLIAEATTILAPAATFLVFSILALESNSTTLLTNRAFTSLAVLALLGAPLASFIQAVPNLLAAVACFRRIQAFLDSAEHSDRRQLLQNWATVSDLGPVVSNLDSMELETFNRLRAPSLQPGVELCAVTVTGISGMPSILEGINLAATQPHLVIVTGPVGSGKTTLLQAILGEVDVTAGSVVTTTRFIAFCAQTTWLQSGSIREQILFGETYHEEWYLEVIHACALVHDLASLTLGDDTEVGDKGEKLSGGQKQRIVSGQPSS